MSQSHVGMLRTQSAASRFYGTSSLVTSMLGHLSIEDLVPLTPALLPDIAPMLYHTIDYRRYQSIQAEKVLGCMSSADDSDGQRSITTQSTRSLYTDTMRIRPPSKRSSRYSIQTQWTSSLSGAQTLLRSLVAGTDTLKHLDGRYTSKARQVVGCP